MEKQMETIIYKEPIDINGIKYNPNPFTGVFKNFIYEWRATFLL